MQFRIYVRGWEFIYVCPECGYEWPQELVAEAQDTLLIIEDANGHVLIDGDTVSIIKDLKVKWRSSVLKRGTKVKNIRLVDGDHNIDCKIDRFGAMKLKSEFVKNYKKSRNKKTGVYFKDKLLFYYIIRFFLSNGF